MKLHYMCLFYLFHLKYDICHWHWAVLLYESTTTYSSQVLKNIELYTIQAITKNIAMNMHFHIWLWIYTLLQNSMSLSNRFSRMLVSRQLQSYWRPQSLHFYMVYDINIYKLKIKNDNKICMHPFEIKINTICWYK